MSSLGYFCSLCPNQCNNVWCATMLNIYCSSLLTYLERKERVVSLGDILLSWVSFLQITGRVGKAELSRVTTLQWFNCNTFSAVTLLEKVPLLARSPGISYMRKLFLYKNYASMFIKACIPIMQNFNFLLFFYFNAKNTKTMLKWYLILWIKFAWEKIITR